MRHVCLIAILIGLAQPLFAATPKDVSYKSGNGTVHGIIYAPEGKGPFPGIIVIHEWWGLNDWVKEQASKLADQGYVALAIDLYRGKVATTPNEAHEFMGGVPQDRAARDLQAAFAYLQSQPSVKKDRIGAIGWCMGGKYTLELATQEPGLKAAVAYYGAPPTDAAAVAKIKAPVLGNYGAEDKGPAPEQVKAFEAAMKKDGHTIDVKLYPGAGHAFANPNNPWGGYREAAAKDAWARTQGFFAKYLKAKA